MAPPRTRRSRTGLLAPARIDEAATPGPGRREASGSWRARGSHSRCSSPPPAGSRRRARTRPPGGTQICFVQPPFGGVQVPQLVIAADHPRRAAGRCRSRDRPRRAGRCRSRPPDRRRPRCSRGARCRSPSSVVQTSPVAQRAGRRARQRRRHRPRRRPPLPPPAAAARPAAAATRATVARRIVGAGDLRAGLAHRVRRALDDVRPTAHGDGGNRKVRRKRRRRWSRPAAGRPAGAGRPAAAGRRRSATSVRRRCRPSSPASGGRPNRPAAPASTSARPSHDFGFRPSRIGVRIRPGRALTMPDPRRDRPGKTQPCARAAAAAFIRKLTARPTAAAASRQTVALAATRA